METADSTLEIPWPLPIALLLVLLVSVAYALIAGQLLLWLVGVVVFGVLAVTLYLFYRLVLAVEQIAYSP